MRKNTTGPHSGLRYAEVESFVPALLLIHHVDQQQRQQQLRQPCEEDGACTGLLVSGVCTGCISAAALFEVLAY